CPHVLDENPISSSARLGRKGCRSISENPSLPVCPCTVPGLVGRARPCPCHQRCWPVSSALRNRNARPRGHIGPPWFCEIQATLQHAALTEKPPLASSGCIAALTLSREPAPPVTSPAKPGTA